MQLIIGIENDEEITSQHPMVVQNTATRGTVGKGYSTSLAVQAVRAGADVLYIETTPSATPYLLFQVAKELHLPNPLEIMQYLGQSYPGLQKILEGGIRWYGPSEDLKKPEQKAIYLRGLLTAIGWLLEQEEQRSHPLVIFLNNVGGVLDEIPETMLSVISTCKQRNISFVVTEDNILKFDQAVIEAADCKIIQHSQGSIEKSAFSESDAVISLHFDKENSKKVIHDSVSLKITKGTRKTALFG